MKRKTSIRIVSVTFGTKCLEDILGAWLVRPAETKSGETKQPKEA